MHRSSDIIQKYLLNREHGEASYAIDLEERGAGSWSMQYCDQVSLADGGDLYYESSWDSRDFN